MTLSTGRGVAEYACRRMPASGSVSTHALLYVRFVKATVVARSWMHCSLLACALMLTLLCC